MCLGIMTVPIINKVILGWVAFGAGFAVAGGFIAFISLIGIVTRLARHPANIPVKRPTILIILRAAV